MIENFDRPISDLANGGVGGIQSILRWEIKLTPQLLLFSGLFAAGIGIFLGYYPSRKASQLDPIASLRYE
jgi:ABC-type antimicrobial peptide transport system permease subunit